MLVYIDTDSGNWGVAESNLRVLDLTMAEVDSLFEMSEDQMTRFAKEHS
jgi:hypothetical protein